MLNRLRTWTGTGPDFPSPGVAISNIGFRNYLRFLYRQWRDDSKSSVIQMISANTSAHPLFYRPKSTDIKVFSQIFMFREYVALDFIREPELIVDCGANVGYSAAYFLTRFPQVRLIAVEPDSENCAILRRNLAPFGSRTEIFQTAVWSHPTWLKIDRAPYRDGGNWSHQVRACSPNDPERFIATDISTLLQSAGTRRISLLKIDVEGAEGVIFAESHKAWIDRVDCIAIEIHDDTAYVDNRGVVVRALLNAGFDVAASGELNIATRPSGWRPPTSQRSEGLQ